MGRAKREMEKYESQDPGDEWIMEVFGIASEMEGTEEWREARKAFDTHVREIRRQEKK